MSGKSIIDRLCEKGWGITEATGPETVTFTDGNLEAAVRDALGKPPGEEIATAELAKLTELEADDSGISDLSGLEYCTSLTRLILHDNEISDIAPLENLTSLNVLELHENQISDVSPLQNLTNLTELRLGGNEISNVSPLVRNSGLGEGDKVWLEDNNLDLSEGSEDMENIKKLEERGVEVHD